MFLCRPAPGIGAGPASA